MRLFQTIAQIIIATSVVNCVPVQPRVDDLSDAGRLNSRGPIDPPVKAVIEAKAKKARPELGRLVIPGVPPPHSESLKPSRRPQPPSQPQTYDPVAILQPLRLPKLPPGPPGPPAPANPPVPESKSRPVQSPSAGVQQPDRPPMGTTPPMAFSTTKWYAMTHPEGVNRLTTSGPSTLRKTQPPAGKPNIPPFRSPVDSVLPPEDLRLLKHPPASNYRGNSGTQKPPDKGKGRMVYPSNTPASGPSAAGGRQQAPHKELRVMNPSTPFSASPVSLRPSVPLPAPDNPPHKLKSTSNPTTQQPTNPNDPPRKMSINQLTRWLAKNNPPSRRSSAVGRANPPPDRRSLPKLPKNSGNDVISRRLSKLVDEELRFRFMSLLARRAIESLDD